MGGVEDGITLDSSVMTQAEKDLFHVAAKQSPEKFGHVVLSEDIPQPVIVLEEN